MIGHVHPLGLGLLLETALQVVKNFAVHQVGVLREMSVQGDYSGERATANHKELIFTAIK